ncbi:MAG: biopolymer transporter ExbD [Verrucomicrobiota bacterium]|jgi:biopolymer transport protein ExbD
MRFYVRKRRTTPAVIIVALIDVLIVLLIFLLVTTTFRQQSALKLQLPQSSQAQKAGANENPPFVVSIDAKGIYYADDNKTPETFEQIRSAVLASVAKNPDLVLAVNADENAPWGHVVKIRDVAAEAKIKSLIAYTKEPAKP